MLNDDRVLDIARNIRAELEARLIGLNITTDEAMRIARIAIRLDAARQRAWTMDSRKARSIDAKAMRVSVQQTERELDDAIQDVKIRQQRQHPSSI